MNLKDFPNTSHLRALIAITSLLSSLVWGFGFLSRIRVNINVDVDVYQRVEETHHHQCIMFCKGKDK